MYVVFHIQPTVSHLSTIYMYNPHVTSCAFFSVIHVVCAPSRLAVHLHFFIHVYVWSPIQPVPPPPPPPPTHTHTHTHTPPHPHLPIHPSIPLLFPVDVVYVVLIRPVTAFYLPHPCYVCMASFSQSCPSDINVCLTPFGQPTLPSVIHVFVWPIQPDVPILSTIYVVCGQNAANLTSSLCHPCMSDPHATMCTSPPCNPCCVCLNSVSRTSYLFHSCCVLVVQFSGRNLSLSHPCCVWYPFTRQYTFYVPSMFCVWPHGDHSYPFLSSMLHKYVCVGSFSQLYLSVIHVVCATIQPALPLLPTILCVAQIQPAILLSAINVCYPHAYNHTAHTTSLCHLCCMCPHSSSYTISLCHPCFVPSFNQPYPFSL